MEDVMKDKLHMSIALAFGFAVLAIPSVSSAQGTSAQSHAAKHHHYKLEVMGTFGGPTGNFYDNFNNISVLNQHGDASGGSADTTIPDSFSSNYQFSNGVVTRAYLWKKDSSLTDLGALLGNVTSAASWLTDNDLVAGLSENGKIDPSVTDMPEMSAVLWRKGKIIDLGPFPGGGFQSFANSVNSHGQVVGAATNLIPDSNSLYPTDVSSWFVPYPYQLRAFIWDEKNGMQDLGTLGAGTNADAQIINEHGQVIGIATTNSAVGNCGGYTIASFIWDKKHGMRDLGGLGGMCTYAFAINENGQVVGISNVAGDTSQRAFIWENGAVHDLGGSLGGLKTGANAINEKGETVGYAALPGETYTHATLWKKPGQLIDLGTVGSGHCSFAWAINSKSQILGESDSADCVNYDGATPFLWENGSLIDLNNLVPPNSPLQLVYAYSINDRGEIAGNGWDASGNEHAFRLVPCDEDHSDLEGCDYSLVDASSVITPHSASSSFAAAKFAGKPNLSNVGGSKSRAFRGRQRGLIPPRQE
jgi:probable HAF family extracellular repeat protein